MEAALTVLAQHGPVSLLAGMIVFVLWRKLNSLQIHYEGDPNDATGVKIGLVARMRNDAQAREDKLRGEYDVLVKNERDENKTLWRETNEAFKGLIDEGE